MPLKAQDKYVGDRDCFLFTLAPRFHVYRTTGIASNCVRFSPHATGQLRGGAYSSSSEDVLGFGGQPARMRLSFEEDLNTLRWHTSCTTYATHPHDGGSLPEGTRRVVRLELYGCGGADADKVEQQLRDRRARDAARAGKVDRAAMFGIGKGDWRDEDNPDKMILETAGAHTFYSAQLEKLPQQAAGEE